MERIDKVPLSRKGRCFLYYDEYSLGICKDFEYPVNYWFHLDKLPDIEDVECLTWVYEVYDMGLSRCCHSANSESTKCGDIIQKDRNVYVITNGINISSNK